MSPKIIPPLNESFAKEMKLENLLVCIIVNVRIELHIDKLPKGKKMEIMTRFLL